MNTASTLLAKHLRDVLFGGNWCGMNYQSVLADVNLKTAQQQFERQKSILALFNHAAYYLQAIQQILQDEALTTKDSDSWIIPVIEDEAAWKNFVKQQLQQGEFICKLLQNLDDKRLWLNFGDEKYGTVFTNILGIIEHLHYHLGQIVLIKNNP